MIQIYSRGNSDFEQNGNMVLFPKECGLHAELGDKWVLEMEHPIDDEDRWKYITEESVLAVPTFVGDKQLFRIKELDKSDTEISLKAYPIFFDSANEVFLMDKNIVNKNGQEALNELMRDTRYSGVSDITLGGTAYFNRRNLMDVINGDTKPTVIGTWGGEVLYDNFKIMINERVGGDYGAEVRYGMNEDGIEYTVDMTSVVTRIFPVAYNGRMLSSQYVDSPLIGKYEILRIKEMKFEDIRLRSDLGSDNTEGLIVCNTQEELDAALINRCNEQYENGLDLPKVHIKVDMIALENTEEYKDFKDLVKVGLGDTVNCYNEKLDITTEARVIELTWDCISKKTKSIVLGDYKQNFIDEWDSVIGQIGNAINADGTLCAEKVKGILDGINAQIRIQSTAAKAVEGRVFIVEDLNEESPLYGCMVFGTQGIQISKKRTEDGKAWDFSTAMTAKGVIADAIVAGLLTDKYGNNYWDLDKGVFSITNGTIKIKAVPSGTWPIDLTSASGERMKLGPMISYWEFEDYFGGISPFGIEVGNIENGNKYVTVAALDQINGVRSQPSYEKTITNAANVYVNANGRFVRSASSSEKYKKDITENISEELKPENLYFVPVKMFKYKDDYISKEDEKYGKDVIGFIVEDMEKYYPAAVQYVNGVPEMWNANILIPAMLQLIQKQNERIKRLEEQYGD